MSYSEVLVKGRDVESERTSRMLEEELSNLEEAEKNWESVEQKSLVSAVKEILPHLGEGFIIECLSYFDQSSERVINAILEDELPDHLRSLSQYLCKEDVQNYPSINPSTGHSTSTRLSDHLIFKDILKPKKNRKTKTKKSTSSRNLTEIEKDLELINKVKIISQQYNSDKNYSVEDESLFHPIPQMEVYPTEVSSSTEEANMSKRFLLNKKRREMAQDTLPNDENEFFNEERRINESHNKQMNYLSKYPNFMVGTKSKIVAHQNAMPTETRRRRARSHLDM